MDDEVADAGQGELALDGTLYDDDQLVAGVRHGDSAALQEFCARFRLVLLDQARRFGVPQPDREAMVMGFLDDLAMKIVHGARPTALAGFVIRSFRNHAIDLFRHERAMQRDVDAHAELVSGDWVVPYTCSAFTTNASRGAEPPDRTADDASRAVRILAAELWRCRTQGERELMTWMSRRVPLRDMAAWLNLSYPATKARVHRLRIKLTHEATAYVEAADEPVRSELRRYMARVGFPLAETTVEGTAR